jgi:hypothetical protein
MKKPRKKFFEVANRRTMSYIAGQYLTLTFLCFKVKYNINIWLMTIMDNYRIESKVNSDWYSITHSVEWSYKSD